MININEILAKALSKARKYKETKSIATATEVCEAILKIDER